MSARRFPPPDKPASKDAGLPVRAVTIKRFTCEVFSGSAVRAALICCPADQEPYCNPGFSLFAGPEFLHLAYSLVRHFLTGPDLGTERMLSARQVVRRVQLGGPISASRKSPCYVPTHQSVCIFENEVAPPLVPSLVSGTCQEFPSAHETGGRKWRKSEGDRLI
jgi:hypothetical protein